MRLPELSLRFAKVLIEIGYVEGRNMAIEFQWADGQPEDFLRWQLIWFAVQ